ncbi:2-C-methyl-D-erythritol 4-phosphate cytidylyltransferase [Clostridia bacterium]|nr:2-C-methyl-D-erythritol 4-phosphate cytidylyltransferase [Clostridia bacterium]
MNNGKKKHTAIILAAGKGKRMGTTTPKQYLLLEGKPLLYYSLKIFEDYEGIDQVILVVGKGEIDFCKTNIIDQFSFQKITQVIEGGNERWESVYQALQNIQATDIVWIHDAARPFLDRELLKRCQAESEWCRAFTTAVPVKDTIKQVKENKEVIQTLERKFLWQVQTPQVFDFDLLYFAYQKFLEEKDEVKSQVTDDAMLIEQWTDQNVKIIMGDYRNIKITTKEDLGLA